MNTPMFLLQVPVPKDVPLALPLPYWLLVAILVFSFLLHIFFVNLMIGSTLLTLWAEIKGLRNKAWDEVAYAIEDTITLNKSLAVVLGVAPLLSINVLYTVYFYTANILTGYMWISVVPLVIVAFLLGYAHKYTWKRLENNKFLHIAMIAAAALIFLFIPFIFLANINLMQFPERWADVEGLFSAIMLNNVVPRYLHFITATMALTGLFVFWFFKRKRYPFEENITGIPRHEVRRKGMSLAFAATVAQLVFGPLLFLTLPARGIEWNIFLYIGLGLSAAIFAMVWMWQSITGPVENMDKKLWPIVIALGITVIFMGTGRQFYRSNALKPHQKLMAAKTEQYMAMADSARKLASQGKQLQSETVARQGKVLFDKHCAACHQPESRLVGPPMKEIVPIYEGKKEALIAWIVDPGRKREDYPPMPGFPYLNEEELEEVAEYIIRL